MRNRKFEKVALIEPGAPGIHVFSKYKLPRLGLPILGAVIKRELAISPKIYFQDLKKLDWKEILSSDLVGISTITSTAPIAYTIVKRIKSERPDLPVVLGGPHVTFIPEEGLLKGADFVVRGEGEETFVELIRCLEGDGDFARVAGLSYLQDGTCCNNPPREHIMDLSSLPWPDLTLIEGFEKSKIIPVLTSRGCPFDCTFCSVTSMFGNRYRFRSTDDVLAELEMLYGKRPKGIFFFYDDNFTASPSRTKELLKRMKEAGITPRWTAQARVDVARDPEMMELMRETNCAFLYLGLESINPKTLDSYRKHQTVEEIVEAIQIIHENGIRVHGMFVLGSDEDTIETVRETVHFAKSTKIDTVQFLILTPIPGSEVYEKMRAEKRIFVDDWSKFSGHHVVFYPKNMPPFKLQKEAAVKAMRKFYSLWQCWKLGLLFRWGDVAVRVYAHRAIRKWKHFNRYFLSELRHRYKAEKAHRKQIEKDKKEVLEKAVGEEKHAV